MSLALGHRAEQTPDELALADARQTLNWREADALLNRMAHALRAFAFGPDRRAAVFARNSSEAMLAYLGCLHGGVSAVPVNSHFTVEELAYVLRESATQLLFVGPHTADVGIRAAAEVGGIEVVGWRVDHPDVTPWADWLNAHPATEPADYLTPRPYLQFTSGTTGFPKSINAVSTTLPPAESATQFFAALNDWAADSPTGPNLVVGPLYFNASLSSVRVLAAGRAQVVLERFDAEEVLQMIDRHRIQTAVMVPTHFRRLLALPAEVRGKYDVSSMQRIIHTGASCPREVKRAMIDWFGPILVEAYGGTESGTTNMIDSHEWLQRPGSVGKTVAPFELEIYSDDGKRLGAGETGQIFFRDTSGRGIVYLNDAEKTRDAHREPGVFTLGDVGYFDADGYLYITDRVADMIVSGGVNIYPAEVERVLIAHPDIVDAAVIGVPNVDFGEEVKALVVRRDGADVSAEAVLDYLREHVAGYKCPRSVDFVADVGRNPAGKINKKKLRAPYWPTERTIG